MSRPKIHDLNQYIGMRILFWMETDLVQYAERLFVL